MVVPHRPTNPYGQLMRFFLEEIQETFHVNTEIHCNLDNIPSAIEKESGEILPQYFVNVRKAPTQVWCKENKNNDIANTGYLIANCIK